LPGDSIAGTLAEPTTLKIALPLEVSESAHEFPPVVFRDGLEFAHVFSIRNNSDHLVRLAGPHGPGPCCGHAELDRFELRPGEQAELSMTVRATSPVASGTCIVRTDCPDHRELVFNLRGRVYPPQQLVLVDGMPLSIFRVRAGETFNAEVRLESYGEVSETSAELPRITSRNPALTVTQIATLGKTERVDTQFSLRRWRISLALDAGLEPGTYDTFLDVSYGDGSSSVHGVRWAVESLFEPQPPRILVTKDTLGHRRQSIRVAARDGEEFQIKSVQPTDTGVDVVVKPTGPAPATRSGFASIIGKPTPGELRT
jgi:hypothetical protein